MRGARTRRSHVISWSAQGFFVFIGAIACITKTVCQLRNVCPSETLSSFISAVPTGRIFVKFSIGDFEEVCQETPDVVQI
jgi:hypothetical protein